MKPDVLNPTGRNHVVVAAPNGGYRCRGCGLNTPDLKVVAAHVVAFQYTFVEEKAK